MEFFKKQSVSFYITSVAVILGVVGLCLYASEVHMVYYVKENVQTNGAVVAFAVLAVVCALATLVLSQLSPTKAEWLSFVVDALSVAVCVFLMLAGMLLLKDRVYYLAITLASDLNAGDAGAFAAAYRTIAVFAVFTATAVLGIVGAFFPMKKV